jgi:hypothetical protein
VTSGVSVLKTHRRLCFSKSYVALLSRNEGDGHDAVDKVKGDILEITKVKEVIYEGKVLFL